MHIVPVASHAREWISGSTVNYVVYNLLNDYGRDANATSVRGAS